MKLISIMKGAKFGIFAIDTSDEVFIEACPAKEFITQMEESSRKSLTAILKRHADQGPIFNKEKSRPLWQGIYEFKTRQGDRVYYFYDSGRLTILTHGSIKPSGQAQLAAEVQKAIDMKHLYISSGGI